MVRYAFINQQVLSIYHQLPVIKFPIDIDAVIKIIPNCRFMSYQRLAEISHCSIEEIIQLCESKSGCTHYDVQQDRYLILCNQSTEQNNNFGRQLWTCAHEIGHILCNHHSITAYEKLAENSLSKITNPEYEAEADYFAAMLLAPFPLYKIFDISSPNDIQQIFGLSFEASQYRYIKYQKWKQTRRKTAWENDIVREYRRKSVK